MPGSASISRSEERFCVGTPRLPPLSAGELKISGERGTAAFARSIHQVKRIPVRQLREPASTQFPPLDHRSPVDVFHVRGVKASGRRNCLSEGCAREGYRAARRFVVATRFAAELPTALRVPAFSGAPEANSRPSSWFSLQRRFQCQFPVSFPLDCH
jgi:hypothetical protein